uniref:helix-turn-helix domain-containing protein n=1 Tax=Streptomyces polyasparticus TaxID=2767826 RepID=UPI00280B49B2|nr:helix-turn-helix domain-containing protein [Streptomyces polyasparticus]
MTLSGLARVIRTPEWFGQGDSYSVIAKELRVSVRSVQRWRSACCESLDRLAGRDHRHRDLRQWAPRDPRAVESPLLEGS